MVELWARSAHDIVRSLAVLAALVYICAVPQHYTAHWLYPGGCPRQPVVLIPTRLRSPRGPLADIAAKCVSHARNACPICGGGCSLLASADTRSENGNLTELCSGNCVLFNRTRPNLYRKLVQSESESWLQFAQKNGSIGSRKIAPMNPGNWFHWN